MTAVAVIGLGAVGGRVARRLLDAGHDVVVWNRTRARSAGLRGLGAVVAASPADAAARAEVVLTAVSDPPALWAVTEGADGIAAGADAPTTVIETSTIGPPAVARLASLLGPGVGLLDAPVLGNIAQVEAGTLRIFVGGPRDLVGRWTPLLRILGTPTHVGPLGAGAAAKLVANATLFGILGVLGEAVALADGLGLTRDTAFSVLAATPLAAQAERRRPAIEAGKHPGGFALSLARKDAGLVMDAATAAGVDVRLAAAAHAWLVDADAAGHGDDDYSAVLTQIVGQRGRRR